MFGEKGFTHLIEPTLNRSYVYNVNCQGNEPLLNLSVILIQGPNQEPIVFAHILFKAFFMVLMNLKTGGKSNVLQ